MPRHIQITGDTMTGDLSVPDEVYGAGWDGSVEVPTKNALYDKIQGLGTGNVSKVGTPVDNQVGIWTGDGTIEGDAALTYDSTTDTLTSVTFAGALTGTASGNEVPLTFGDGLTRTVNDVDVDAAQPGITTAVALPWTGLAPGVDGEIPTFDASGNPAFVAVGTATHVLTSNGAGAAPTFQAPSGSGLTQPQLMARLSIGF